MIFWLDAQLDPELAPWLGSRFRLVAKTVREIGLRDAEDDAIFDAGKRLGDIVIITKDQDLVSYVRRLGPPPRILWLRFGNMATVHMQLILSRRFGEAISMLEAGEAAVQITPDTVEPAR